MPAAGWTRVVEATPDRRRLTLRGYLDYLGWLAAHWALIVSLTRTQLKLTVSQSRVYYLWWMFDPILDTACYALLFALIKASAAPEVGEISGVEALPTIVFLLAGIVPWRLNQACWSSAGTTWQSNKPILEQIRFPHLALLISRFLGEAWLYVVAVAILLVACVVFGVMPAWTWLLIPFWVLAHGLLVLAFMPLFAIGPAFSQDILKLLPYFLRLGFFASPILYPLSVVPDWARPILLLNPVTLQVETYRQLIAGEVPAIGPILIFLAAMFAVLIAGSYLFIRLQSAMSRSVSRIY